MQTTTKTSPYYENLEFNVDTATEDYDLDSEQSGFLNVFGSTNVAAVYPSSVHIRTNNTISVKLNSTDNDAITITSTDSPFVIEGVEIVNLFITNNSGSTAAVKLLFQDSKY